MDRRTAAPILTMFVLIVSWANMGNANPLVFEGETGPGQGMHIVFLAGDHEYRSEESLPALARILAKRHGFKCTVLFTLDPLSGEILPGSSHMPGTEALATADLMVIFLRFQNFPAEQMQPIVDYIHRGGAIIGMRTSTHAFKIPSSAPFEQYSYDFQGAEFTGGFGRQVLGETWAGHYGKNHVMSTRLDIVPDQQAHPILKGVNNLWVQSGGYWVEPVGDAVILAMAQPLNGMTPDSPAATDKAPCPGVWTREYTGSDGQRGRVVTTTYGASEDLLNPGFRRLLINACYWALRNDDQINGDAPIEFVGPYQPTTFKFNGHRPHVLPSDLTGWESTILPAK